MDATGAAVEVASVHALQAALRGIGDMLAPRGSGSAARRIVQRLCTDPHL